MGTVELLLRKSKERGAGANSVLIADNHGNSCLHYACQAGSFEIVEVLLRTAEASELLDTVNEQNRSALHVAASHGRAKCCRALVEVC